MSTVEEKIVQKEVVKKTVGAKKKRAAVTKKPAAAKKPAVAKKAATAKNKNPAGATPRGKKKSTAAKKTKPPTETKKKPSKPAIVKKASKSAAPVKQPSAFTRFKQEHLAKVKAEYPNDSAGQIGKRLGDMWRVLSKEEKAAYKPVLTAAAAAVAKKPAVEADVVDGHAAPVVAVMPPAIGAPILAA